MASRVRLFGLYGVIGSVALACGGAPESATRNRTFYDWQVATESGALQAFERPYPPLDLPEAPPRPGYAGVSVLEGGVRLSRPMNWKLRDAGNVPGQRYVSYISPNAYSFAIYERPDPRGDDWKEVMRRYEDDAQSVGAKVVASQIPVAVAVGQGRAYTIEREVEAAKRPFVSKSREYVIRGENRIVLVQIVYQGETLTQVTDELLRVLETLEVL
ncbi:MAG: hypothetical protein DIU78_006700 [Pseudomonadota bacterium]|nr:MAG: hypothetical protein DIU78_05715 [Pseudomonadota bacterium]